LKGIVSVALVFYSSGCK